ncbi:MAG: D-alanyl-D-alanine carboxypeptidase, partial [Caldanaerobacter sp.]
LDAPVEKGEKVGWAVVKIGEEKICELDCISLEKVGKQDFVYNFKRVITKWVEILKSS